jgi:hypothetical protein
MKKKHFNSFEHGQRAIAAAVPERDSDSPPKQQAFAFGKCRKMTMLFLLLAAMLGGFTPNAFTINGSGFTTTNLLRDLKWNTDGNYLEFAIMAQDDRGNSKNESISRAYVHIDGQNIFDIGDNHNNVSDETMQVKIGWMHPSPNGKVYISAQSINIYPNSWENTPYQDYEINTSDLFAVSEIPGYPTDDANRKHYQYARFRWYPNKIITAGMNITVELKSIVITEQNSGAQMDKPDISKSVTVPVLTAPGSQRITDGTIQQGGGLKFTTSATGASCFILKKGDTVLETKFGSSATFTGKYLTTATDFRNGVSFGFDVQKQYGSGNKTTTYQWTSSQTQTSQRTGTFTDNLSASLSTCGKVNLSWIIANPLITSGINTSGFDIQVKKGSDGWTDVTGDVDYKASIASKSTYSYTYTIPPSDLNKGTITYQFRIKRTFADWGDAQYSSILQVNKIFPINTNYKELTNIVISPGEDNRPRLSWKMSTSGIECNDNITVKLSINGTETPIPADSVRLANPSYQVQSGDGIVSCIPQRYQLILQYGTLPAITYPVIDNYVYEATGKREFESITVSKGYYADRNNVRWTLLQGYDEFDRFRLLRKELTASDDSYVTVAEFTHTGILQYNYDDNNINAGIYYEYKVEGIYTCSASTGSLSSPTDIGFSQPYGSVSGRITYAGSSAVKDVQVNVKTDNALRSNRELEFSSSRANNVLTVPANANLFSREGFSFQTWLRFQNSTAQTLLENGFMTLTRGTNDQLTIQIDNKSSITSTIIGNGEYAHLTITAENLSSDYKSYRITVYVNGKQQAQQIVNRTTSVPESSETHIGETLSGILDDIRIWSKTLTAEEIVLNYDRVLGGKEADLAAYYQCNEIDAVNAVYDCSANGANFNGNHAVKGSGVNRQDVSLTANHISIKGVTDGDGIYTITNAIPYTSEGTNYTLTPSFGIHTFDPSKQPLYFTSDIHTFNGINFTDISSFPVSGQITYAGSNYPVEGAQIAIDGLVANKDGKMIETAVDGTFTVDVPIGAHFITVSKQGHIFENEGRFPANPLEKYNFQTSVNGLQFTDQTTVRLVGRVVGGNLQTDQPLGFGLSNANIGQATIKLQTVNDVYRLNLTANDSIVVNTADSLSLKTSATTFKSSPSGSVIEIETNPETGEFLAVLPPVPYSITGLKTKDFEDTFTDGDAMDFNYSKGNFDINPNANQRLEYTDTTEIVHYFTVHDSLRITRYNEPTIAVRDLGAEDGAFGDSVCIYRNTVLNISDTIPLYKVQPNGTVNYTFGYPFFSQKQQIYTWEVSTYEEYINHDDDANPQTETVPLAGQTININNGLASGYTEITDAGEQITLTSSESEITLNDEGKKKFRFRTGFPKIGGDHLLSTKLVLDHNGKEIVWNNNQSAGNEFQGYLMGQVPTDGLNFVTQGPDMIDIVLPDPPGSFSFSYIEKGSSITSSHENTYNFEVSEIGELTIHSGPKHDIGMGLGVWTEVEFEAIVDLKGTAGGKQTKGKGNRIETTVTFNEQISTSSDIAFVGSQADVYIGSSTNLTFGQVRQLSFYPVAEDNTGSSLITADNRYSLFPKEITAIGNEFSTMFTYTQEYILNTLIPNTKVLRNQLIQYYPAALPSNGSGLTFTDNEGKPVEVIYLSNMDVTDPQFGKSGTYKAYYPDNAIAARKLLDDVASYNSWIANWEKAIANNEESKIGLFDKRSELESKMQNGQKMMSNRSFNAGVNISESITTEYTHVTLTDTTNVILGEFSETIGVRLSGMGAEETFTVGRDNTWDDQWEDGTSSSITFGYELLEDGGDYLKGVNDAITVDIYQPVADEMIAIVDEGTLKSPIKTLRGYTFRTRAGQTSCPFEPADSTLFYKKDGKKQLLNYGTFQIEKPDLYINNSKSASAENIPAGREATFNVQMNNMSDTKDDVTYQLSIGDYSNLNGLILSIDGTPLTEPREYTIEYGQELEKTLKVRQSSQDILDYDHVELVLSSTCDDSEATASSATLSVKFTPSSSPVTLASNSRLANIEGMNKGGTIRFTVSDYEPNYKNFGCIRLQYRSAVNENWITLREYVNDESLYPVDSPDKEKIDGRPSLAYDFNYDATVPSDGEYIFRAVSVSKIGTDEITFNSDEVRVVKDTKSPQALGYPAPMNGILNAGDEISVTFNENIQSDKLVGGTVGSNFRITGILNADMREEPTSGTSFSGAQSAYTEQPIYANGSFSIETWFKRTNNTAGTLFAYGSGNEYISLEFDSGHAVVRIGDESHTSTEAINNADDTWKYIGMAYDRETDTVSVTVFQGTETLNLFNSRTFTNKSATSGKLYLGNTSGGDSGFSGAAALLHFYDNARTSAQMSATKSLTKSGTETGLIGLWELEEDEGALAKDKARSRHLTLNNTGRYIYPLGKSLAIDGSNQYARITSGTFPFGISDDFTLELWFKGGSQGAATLLSVGTNTHIGFDAEHRLVLSTGGNTQILAPAGLLDDKWRHLALSVKRNGMARTLIDGTVTASFNSEMFGDIGGGYYHLGVKYAIGAASQTVFSEYFTGNIDELRVWNSALTTEAIVLNKNHSLRGDEAGLKAYYPFERTQQVNGSIYSANPSLADVITEQTVSPLTASLTGVSALSDVSAPLQLARPVKNVPFTFAASNNKVVLNITEEEYRIEGVTLYITAENILDMHDNTSSAINWTAYVNRNALNWNTNLVDLAMEVGDNSAFKALISNNSGEKQDYFIENLPAWLSVDASQGSLSPLSVKELTFTVTSGINIGTYEASISLSGLNNVQKILPVRLRVTGNRPDWSVNPSDYEQSMTVMGQLLIKDYPQDDTEDLIAAFIGNTCVGLASPKYEPAYQDYPVYLQIWGNTSDNGSALTFKIWDASTGNIYPIVEAKENGKIVQLQYAGNSLKGTPGAPILLNALDAIEQTILLNSGWNWISFNIDSPSLTDVNTLMNGIANGIEIKGQTSFSHYEANNSLWTNGSMNGEGLSNTQMYMLKMSGTNTIAFPGSPVNPDDVSITLNSGWNWISYIPQVNETVEEAFAGANPQNGDLVKSQTAFSVYDNKVGWVGTLEYMRPGQGYMYNTVLQRNFKYPKTGIMTRSIKGNLVLTEDSLTMEPLTLNRSNPSLNGGIAPNYENNLSLIGEVKISSDQLSESARLIAMVDGERRGMADMRKAGDKYLFFLPVYSDSPAGTVTFMLENNGKEIPLQEYIAYKPNAVIGIFHSPILLTDAGIDMKVYPNPFTDHLTASFETEARNANVKVELVSMTGAIIYSTMYTIANPGTQFVDIDSSVVGSLTEGKYIIRVTLNNNETFTNIVIKGAH